MDLNGNTHVHGPAASVAATLASDFLEPEVPDRFPFARHLDLTPVLEFWESLVRDEHGITADAGNFPAAQQ